MQNECAQNSGARSMSDPKPMENAEATRTTMDLKNKELMEMVQYLHKFEKDLYDLNSNLEQIGMRINPEDHFIGVKSDGLMNKTGDLGDEKGPRRYNDGLVGTMDAHIQQLNARIDMLQLGISLALRHVRYLQEQI